MRTFALAAILALGGSLARAQDAAKADLSVSLATDKSDYVLNDDVMAEVTVTNAGDKTADVSELTFEDRSLSFDITFDAGGGATKQFVYSIVRPDPHIMERIAPARVAIKSKKSLVGVFRIPTLHA